MNCNQSTVQRALQKAEEMGIAQEGLKSAQLKIDWFDEQGAA